MTLATKTAARAALERPYARENDASTAQAMERGKMPRTLADLLRWYAKGWDIEVPDSIHKAEVWIGRPGEGVPAEHTGGSHLGTRAYTDPFRRYVENVPSETDVDGCYVRPMHAALSRMGRRYPLTARVLFAVAQAGYDWRGVAERMHYADEMFSLYLTQALAHLWSEYRSDVVRLQ